MDEYGIVFFNLIENSLRQDGMEYMILANISAIPFMKKQDAKEVLNEFKKMGEERGVSKADIKADRHRLARILKGKMV